MANNEPIITAPARLVAACHCGTVISAPCPTLGDMRAAHDAIKAVGWAWYEGIGHACSAACASAAEEAAALRQGCKSGSRKTSSVTAAPLFDEVA